MINILQPLHAMEAARKAMQALSSAEAEIIAQVRNMMRCHAIPAQHQATGNASPAHVTALILTAKAMAAFTSAL